MLTNIELLDLLASEYERKRINDTDEYKRWLLYGFACASFGEAGKSAFKKFSKSSYKYDELTAERQFERCKKAYKGQRDSLKNILPLMRDCGIYLKNLLINKGTG